MEDFEEMMEAFEEYHGKSSDYDAEGRDMWRGWLGVFTLGWQAHKKHLLTQRAIDPPSACEGCGVVPGQGEHDRSCPVVSAGN